MIELRNMAKVKLPKDDKEVRALILGMYAYENRYTGEVLYTYKYNDGVCYLPPNMDKLKVVAEFLGEEIVDNRSKGSPLGEPFVLQPEFKLREYQIDPFNKFVEYVKENKYGTLLGGTGSGKTLVMTRTYGELGGKCLVLLDQKNLIPSWIDAAKLVWGKEVQQLKATDTEFSDVSLSSFQLLARNEELLNRVKKEYMTTCIDECHVSAATSYRKVLSALDNFYRISCTASFIKKGFSDAVLSDFMSPISVTMKNDNALIPEIQVVKTGITWPSSDPAYFTSSVLPNLATDAKRNALILQLARDGVSDGRVVAIICITKKQAELINMLLVRAGVKSVIYVGTTSAKKDRELKERMESGEIQVAVTVAKILKGFDVVTLDMLILARPDNSEVRAIQTIGRTTRILENKRTPIVYDLNDEGHLSDVFARNRMKFYKKLGYTISKED